MKDEISCLVVITPGFPANENDSACLPWIQSFILKLNESYPGLKIVILTLEYPLRRDHYNWFNNEVLSFNGWEKSKIQKLLIWLNAWRSFNKTRKKYRVVGIVSYWCGEAAFLGHQFAKRTGLKHIIRVCGQDAGKENKWVQRIQPKAEELVPLSDFLVDEFFKNHGIKSYRVVPMAVDPKTFPTERPDKKDIDILGVGALIPLKRYDMFVEIAHELSKHLPSLKAVHCGAGSEENRIREMIDSLSLQENLLLTGKLPHPDILNMMLRAKIFLHTSEYEGFSAACLEALFAGAYVISFCKPMNDEIENWFIVYSKEEMIRKSLELLQNPSVKFESKLPYSSDNSAKEIMDILGYTNP